MAAPRSLVGVLADGLIGALNAADPLPIMRDGPRHVVAQPRVTRTEAIDWLFQGRANPDESRLRPDPLEGLESDPQRRFLLDVTAEEFGEARPEFRERYLLDGPQRALVDLLPTWLPDGVRQEIKRLNEARAFRRATLPNFRTFPGVKPWGNILVWAGLDEFGRPSLEIFNYFPEAPEFYEQLPGVGTQDARLLRQVFVSWNNDIRYFVEELHMRPQDARDELRRIWGEVFKEILEAIARTLLPTGAGISAANKIAATADSTVGAVLQSFRQKRELYSLCARTGTLQELVVYRGTTWNRILGDLVLEAEHDLGRGTYFTLRKLVAKFFSQKYPTPDDPAVFIRVKAKAEDLGNVLDLAHGPLKDEWDALAAPALKFVPRLANEPYNNLLSNYLESKGLTLNSFDTIIAPDYLNGGIQMCIKKESIARKLLLLGDEVPLPLWRK